MEQEEGLERGIARRRAAECDGQIEEATTNEDARCAGHRGPRSEHPCARPSRRALIAMIAPSVASQSQGVDMTAAWVGITGCRCGNRAGRGSLSGAAA